MNYDLENFNEKINIDDLYKRKLEVQKLKTNIFKTILKRIHKRITVTSRQKVNDSFCFYVMPTFIIGTPTYDVDTCTSYIIQKLRDNGFMVKYTHPNLLFISWKNWIPLHERLEYKKKTGKTIDGKGNFVKEVEKQPKKSIKSNLLVVKKKDDNFKKINTYKSSGTLIYDRNLLNKIEQKVKNIKTLTNIHPKI